MKLKCPVCNKVTTWEENPHRPFCSERCKLIDLGRWASDEYRINGKGPAEGEKGEERQNEAPR